MGIVALALTACGGGGSSSTQQNSPPPPPPPSQYSIGGTVTGLSGTGLVLQDNGGDDLKVTANGAFTFATKVNSGGKYAVTVLTQPSGQTCTVSNGSGTASANVTNVAVSCANSGSNVTIGGTVTGLTGTGLVLQDNGGDDLKVTQNGAFTFATALAGGASYKVTVSTQPSSPSQTCTVTNGTGTTGSTNVTNVTVTCAATMGKFAYVANYADGTIDAYTIDPNTGELKPIGAPVADGTHPAAVSLSPDGKFAFSASDNDMKINAFTIDQTSGALTPVPGSPFPTGFTIGMAYPDIAVDAQSAHLYLASSGDGKVAGFAIDSAGKLTPLTGSPYTAGAGAAAIPAFSPDGKFLYVMNEDTTSGNSVSGYSIDGTTGALTPIAGSPFPAGTKPTWISFTPDGKFAYVSDSGVDLISAYSVNATTGALTPLSTPTFATDAHPADLSIDSTGTHLYVPVSVGTTNGAIDVYTINADGTLTPVQMTATAQPVGIGPLFVALDPTGKFAYVTSAGTGGTGVYGFSIGSNGALTAVAGSPFPTGTKPQFLTIDPSGKFGYTANEGSATVSGFAISTTTGVLTATPNSPYAAGNQPIFVSISPEAPGVRD